jgi:hypothetical protein
MGERRGHEQLPQEKPVAWVPIPRGRRRGPAAETTRPPCSCQRRRVSVSTAQHTRMTSTPRAAGARFPSPLSQAPAGGRFSVLAASAIKRFYHSTAMLLPSGDLLVMGSEQSERGWVFPFRVQGLNKGLWLECPFAASCHR